jgi:hypothetical protein
MTKPKFCQGCGGSFSSKEAGPVAKKQKAKKKVEAQITPEIKKETIPENINKLEFDTIGTLQVKGAALGQLVGTSEGTAVFEGRARSTESNLSKEEFLEQFKKEAGTSRPATDG